jgi:hypothetical protein
MHLLRRWVRTIGSRGLILAIGPGTRGTRWCRHNPMNREDGGRTGARGIRVLRVFRGSPFLQEKPPAPARTGFTAIGSLARDRHVASLLAVTMGENPVHLLERGTSWNEAHIRVSTRHRRSSAGLCVHSRCGLLGCHTRDAERPHAPVRAAPREEWRLRAVQQPHAPVETGATAPGWGARGSASKSFARRPRRSHGGQQAAGDRSQARRAWHRRPRRAARSFGQAGIDPTGFGGNRGRIAASVRPPCAPCETLAGGAARALGGRAKAPRANRDRTACTVSTVGTASAIRRRASRCPRPLAFRGGGSSFGCRQLDGAGGRFRSGLPIHRQAEGTPCTC